ncbi:MAG: Dabb family protein [Pseudomonadota bacterium]
MIVHCVFCEVADAAACAAVIADLEAFAAGLEGVVSFEGGPNRDFEAKSPDFEQGFVIRFESRAALAEYAEHPTHKALGARLVAACRGGAEGITVFDIETE